MIAPAIRLTATGIDETITRLDELRALYLTRVRDVLNAWGAATVAKIIEGHPPGGPHPPAGVQPEYGQHAYIDRTGRLTRSVGHTVEAWSSRTITLTVFATMPYAELVEYGTPRSRPYPFFWPVIWERLPQLESDLQVALDALFREMGELGRS